MLKINPRSKWLALTATWPAKNKWIETKEINGRSFDWPTTEQNNEMTSYTAEQSIRRL